MTLAVDCDVNNQTKQHKKYLGVSGPKSVNIPRTSGSSILFKFDGNNYSKCLFEYSQC